MSAGAPSVAEALPPEAARALAARADLLERRLDGPPPAVPRPLRWLQEALGALAIGLFCAGLSILGVFVLLTLVFHHGAG
ncbi:MAG: hypothetical protein ACQEUZ_00470 [Pseudomonadota bacterium]